MKMRVFPTLAGKLLASRAPSNCRLEDIEAVTYCSGPAEAANPPAGNSANWPNLAHACENDWLTGSRTAPQTDSTGIECSPMHSIPVHHVGRNAPTAGLRAFPRRFITTRYSLLICPLLRLLVLIHDLLSLIRGRRHPGDMRFLPAPRDASLPAVPLRPPAALPAPCVSAGRSACWCRR